MQSYSTLKNITSDKPVVEENSVVGSHLTYPDTTGRRAAEGGLRLHGNYKKRIEGTPLVSIITVCLDSAKTLMQCMQSVFKQSYSNIEYIIVDGGSSDGSVNLIKQYEHAIDYYISEPDGGIYNAMNKGLALASGDYVLVLNSDDWYARDCVEALVMAKKYSNADLVSGLAQYIDSDGREVQLMRQMPYDEGIHIRMPLRHETMLLSRDIYNSVGKYEERYKIISDLHYALKIFDAGYSLYELPRPLLFFRNSGLSNMDRDGLIKERMELIKEQFPFISDNDAGLFGDEAKLTPGLLQELAFKYPGNEKLIKSLKMYYQDRKKTSVAEDWCGSEISWPENKNNVPQVSVILPVFNARDTLKNCLDSVLSQTLKDFELICINDASTDDSQQLIDTYQCKDYRIVSVVNEENIGLGSTRNRGISIARGEYIFHIDPDDTIPLTALEVLYTTAVEHDSDMVKGSYWKQQFILGQILENSQINRLCQDDTPIINTRLKDMPELLRTTEGHWSYLYKRDLAKRVRYPRDLKMGQDSIFLVNILVQAEKITVIGDVVYHYRANATSAMNTYTFIKYMDDLEWRRRAWHVLYNAGMNVIGNRLLQTYWTEHFFTTMASTVSYMQLVEFFNKFRNVYSEAGITSLPEKAPEFINNLFSLILECRNSEAYEYIRNSIRLKVVTFTSNESGGAGIASKRRIKDLRKAGIDARMYSLIVNSTNEYIFRIIPDINGIDTSQQSEVWEEVRKRAVYPVLNIPGYCSREFFSLSDSVLDFRKLKGFFDSVDVIHFDWVVGMIDYKHISEILSDKPVVWTLHDMNPFTGGCHYSESCDEYKRSCNQCPLLGGQSNLAHKTWKIKKQAYERLKNLHIVCPSKWLAECVRSSSLLGDKPVHTISNSYPADRFVPENKIVARTMLGLPVDKKLIMFGVENLAFRRKGGDLLQMMIEYLKSNNRADDIEVLICGYDNLEIDLPVHNFGYVADEQVLSQIYSAADVYVLPTREDNAPLTAGESLLCGTPVISFAIGFLPDIIEHKVTGYLAKYLDYKDMAKGIRYFLDELDDETVVRRSIKARLAMQNLCSDEVTVNKYITLYNKLSGSNTSDRG